MLIFIFSIYIVNATPVLELQHSTVQPQETLIGTISTEGIFLEDLTRDDITFYEGRKQVVFDYDLYYYNGTYYFYVIFNKEGDFTIKIKEILFNLAGEVGSKKLEQTIPIRYSNMNNQTGETTNLLSIKPGIVYSLDNSATLSLFNRGSNDLTVNIGETSLIISAFQATTVQLNLVYPLTYVTASTYKTFSIPIIFLGAKVDSSTQITNQTNITEIPESQLLLEQENIEIIARVDQETIEIIELVNLGEGSITNLTITNEMSVAEIGISENIAPGDSGELQISIFADYETYLNRSIVLTYEENGYQYSKEISVVIYITEEDETEIPIVEDGELCADIGGNLCEGGRCEGEREFTSDGSCCIGECIPIDSVDVSDGSSSNTWIYGVLIFIVLGIVGYFVYRKYKKVKPEEPEQKIEKSKEKYENRMKGTVTRH